MDIRIKLGQRLIAGLKGPELDEEFTSLIRNYKVGNVILFSRNLKSVPQTRKLVADITALIMEETGIVPFITIDQEGGIVTRLSPDAVNAPGAMALSASAEPDAVYKGYSLSARELAYLGINFNLVPDMDVNSNPLNPVIGVRSFSDDRRRVARCGIAAFRATLEQGVMASAKHFPGHGDTATDSHIGLPVVDKSLEELLECDLYPFIEAIKAGIPAIMTSHILFPQIEKDGVPATMSRTILKGLLREKLGYGGLIISDCMEMGAIKDNYGTVNGVHRAFEAGVDMAFISHTASYSEEVIREQLEMAEKGTLDLETLETSLSRILHAKSLLGKTQTSFDFEREEQTAVRLLESTFVRVPYGSKVPLEGAVFIAPDNYRSSDVVDSPNRGLNAALLLSAAFSGRSIVISADPDENEVSKVLSELEDCQDVNICTFNANVKKGQSRLLEAVLSSGRRVRHIVLSNPYDAAVSEGRAEQVFIWEYTRKSVAALIDVLKRNSFGSARLPLSEL